MLKDQLASFSGEIAQDAQTLTRYSRDASLFFVRPSAVAFPKSVSDIKTLVRYVSEHPGTALTARAAGTDMTGGPLSDSVIVDMTRHFNRIGRIDAAAHTAIVEPGVFYRDFELATLAANLFLPSYPASREMCTVGGMVANNAGGEKTLAYGKTERYVHRLKVILADGNEYSFSPLTAPELAQKESQRDFEGEAYRRLHELIERNYERIQNARPKVSKNSAGYAVWDVWDRGVFDMTKLFTGSQGTLGIITEIEFRLVEPMPHSVLLAIFLRDIAALGKLVAEVLKHKPETFESFDNHTLMLTLRYLPSLMRLLKAKSIDSLAWRFLPEFWMAATGGIPKLVLLAEFTAATTEEATERAQRARAALAQLPAKTHLITTAPEAQKYWTMRRESFNLLRNHLKGKRTAPFIDDIIVRPEYLPEFLPQLNEILEQYKTLTYTIAGHAGDGNFHIIPLVDARDPHLREIIKDLSEKVYALVNRFHGSITAEHNDGLIRTPFLSDMFGRDVYQLFGEVKRIFDPKNIFNPRKKYGGTLAYALEHLYQENK